MLCVVVPDQQIAIRCRYNTRHVALKFAYLGWDYQGFAAQDDTNRTIEAVLFDALLKTRLIESRLALRCSLLRMDMPAFRL